MRLNPTPITTALTKEVQSRFMKFLVVLRCGTTGHAMDAAAALTAVRNATFELERVNETGSYSPCRKFSLLNYLEIGSALSHGSVNVTTSGDTTTIKGDIIICFDGDIVPKAREQYILKIAGLAAYCEADVYVMATKKDGTVILDYNRVKTFQDSPTPVDLTAAHLLVMPKADITKLELEGAGDARLELLSEELDQHLNDLNANAFNINGAVTPVGLDLYAFPVQGSNRGIFTATADKLLIVVNAQRI